MTRYSAVNDIQAQLGSGTHPPMSAIATSWEQANASRAKKPVKVAELVIRGWIVEPNLLVNPTDAGAISVRSMMLFCLSPLIAGNDAIHKRDAGEAYRAT